MLSEMIHLEGHVIDSLVLSKVLDILSSTKVFAMRCATRR